MEFALEALGALAPLAQLSEETIRTVAESDQALSAVLLVGGLLVGAYGSAGEFRWVTATGIGMVLLAVLIQFGTVSGDEGSAIEVVLPAALWILATLAGFLLVSGAGAGLAGGLLRAVGVVVLALCLAAIALPLFGVDGGPLPGPFDAIDVDSGFR